MNFFKRMGLKLKLALGFAFAAITFVAYFIIRGKIRIKDQLEYELSRLKSEIEITNLEEKTEEAEKKIKNLKKDEKKIREKIAFIEERESKGEEVSLEDLDKFFDERGF